MLTCATPCDFPSSSAVATISSHTCLLFPVFFVISGSSLSTRSGLSSSQKLADPSLRAWHKNKVLHSWDQILPNHTPPLMYDFRFHLDQFHRYSPWWWFDQWLAMFHYLWLVAFRSRQVCALLPTTQASVKRQILRSVFITHSTKGPPISNGPNICTKPLSSLAILIWWGIDPPGNMRRVPSSSGNSSLPRRKWHLHSSSKTLYRHHFQSFPQGDGIIIHMSIGTFRNMIGQDIHTRTWETRLEILG